jgi:hypothetical protein
MGFIEADGCLTYAKVNNDGTQPIFFCCQQDEVAMRNLHAILGGIGIVSCVTPKGRNAVGTRYKTRWQLRVARKYELLEFMWWLVDKEFMTGHKKRDYDIWSRMAKEYIASDCNSDLLRDLATQLSVGRKGGQAK